MQFAELIASFKEEKLPHSEVELKGDVPAEAVMAYRDEALKHLAEHAELPGFRKGKVPADMLLKKVGEAGVMEEAAELFMRDFYPELVAGKSIDALGRPDIRITKLAPGNPVSLVIRTAVYPKVDIPSNWKRLAQGISAEEAKGATDEEVNQTLESLRQSRATTHEPDLATGAAEAPVVPELTDEFARSLGAFKDLAELKDQVKKGIGEEKARQTKDARRGKIIEALLEKTSIDMPRLFVESELDKIVAQMREDVRRMGMGFDDYLKRANKTEEDIRTEFRGQAEKRAKLQLLLNQLAEEEKVEPKEEDIQAEMKHALEHFPDADPERLRIHIETVLRNEAVLKRLEEAA